MSIFEYAPAPESRAVVDIKESYGLFVNGEFTSGAGTAFKTVNPATEEVLAEVAEADASDVDRAVKAARKAYDKVWGPMPGRERAKYLYRIARIIQERSRELAVLETLDNGKPIKEARDVDVPTVAAHFFYYAGWADKLEYSLPGNVHGGTTPLGVAGQVIPWNFPLLMLAWKVAPALACGNTVVLKPAETTPLTALLFAEICQQADLPPGVVNILTGAGGYFCAGMDLKTANEKPPSDSFESGEFDPSVIKGLLKGFRLTKPLVAAVEGPAIAGGTEILQGTDIRVAGESAKFGVAEARWSLYPMGGSAVRLPRQIPYTVAAEAKELGLIGHVVPDGSALEKAREIADMIAANGPLAVQAILKTMRDSEGKHEEECWADDAKVGAAVFSSDDAKEGPRAFLEKRKPEFQGK